MDKEEKDVKDESSTSTDDQNQQVENGDDSQSDKDQNFKNLRDKNKSLEEENERLKKENETLSGGRSLSDDDSADDDAAQKGKQTDSAEQVLFSRDLKEATIQWNKENSVSPEIWQQIKDNIVLKGDETLSEIKDKIQGTYEGIPSVKEKIQQDLINKGKQEAMREFSDSDLDISGGGDNDSDTTGARKPRMDDKTKKWGKGLGLNDKELSEVDQDEDPSGYKILDPDRQDGDIPS